MVRCKTHESTYAFYKGKNLPPDTEFMMDEEDLKPDANGNKTIPPRWCILLEPPRVVRREYPPQREPRPEAGENEKPDIFKFL